MGRATKAVGKTGKKRRIKGSTAKPRSAPKAEGGGRSTGVNRVAQLTRELKEALERQSAAAGILQIIANSPADVQPVFEAVAESAMSLLDCWSVIVTHFDGEYVHFGAARGALPDTEKFVRQRYPMRPNPETSLLGRSLLERTVISSPDAQAEADPQLREYARMRGYHGQLVVPLLCDGKVEGALALTRAEIGPFTQREIALVQTFADHAVIAIQNVRMFAEVQARTRELQESLEYQTATSDVLKVISRSTFDLQPVLDSVCRTAQQLCGAGLAGIAVREGERYRYVATSTVNPEWDRKLRETGFTAGRGSVAGRVALERRVVHIADLVTDAEYSHPEFAAIGGARTALGVPLIREGEPLGVIFLGHDRVRPFTEQQIELVRTFADQAVIAIQNARMFNETREALERQTATADVLKVIASSPSEVQPVFEAIAERSNRLVGGHSTAVYRFINETVELAAFTRVSPEADAVLQGAFPRRLADHPMFRLVRGGEVIQIPDTESALGAEVGVQEIARARGFRSLLLTPLSSADGPIGLISVTRKETGTIAEHHVQLLRTFADQAVIAIQNVNLFEEVKARTRELEEALQQQTATADVLKVISRSAFDLQTVLDTLVRSAVALCGARGGLIYLKTGDAFYGKAFADYSQQFIRHLETTPQRPGRGSVGARVLLTGEVQNIADLREDREYDPLLLATTKHRAVLGVPLLRDKTIVGAIVVGRDNPEAFTQREIELVQTFADQAVIAIENVRLFEEVQAKTRDLEESLEQQTATAEVLKVISSSPGELEPVFQSLLENAVHLCGAEFAMLFLYEENEFRAVGKWNLPPAYSEFLGKYTVRADPMIPLGRAAITKQPVQVADILVDQSYIKRHPGIVAVAEGGGARTLLQVPMLKENELVGTIGVYRQEVRPFNDKQVTLVQNFAAQAVIAIENARLLNELQQRTADLSESLQFQTASAEVLKVISRSPDALQPVFDAIVETARDLCDSDGASIFLLRDGKFHFTAVAGAVPKHLEYLRASPAPNDGPVSVFTRAFKLKRTVHYPNVAEDPDLNQGHDVLGGPRALLVAPLMCDGEVLGVIILRQSHLKPFTLRQIQAIEMFADQAVIAMSNVNLFNEVQQRTRELAKSLDDLRTAQDRLIQTEKLASLGQLTAGIAHEIKNPLNFVNNFSALSAELTDELNELLARAELAGRLRQEVGELTALLKDNLSKVVQHGKRADSIVKNMLLHSREGSGERRSADINALVGESLNLAYHGARAEKAGFSITLKHDLDPAVGAVDLYPQEITRALLNLISNGFYAATRRKVEASDETFEPVLSATTRNLGKAVEIRIRDNGNGISSEVREKMFNPFFTTKPTGEGTGLGLSMTHDIIVKQHGGGIDVETEIGAFTEFIITLPRDNGRVVDQKPE